MIERKRKLPSWITDHAEEAETRETPATPDQPRTNSESQIEEHVAGKDVPADTGEDDYLDMTFEDNAADRPSLISQRQRRLLEKQDRGRHGPKSTTTAPSDHDPREKALEKSLFDVGATSLPPSKALRMMERMGYSAGQALGDPSAPGLIEPLRAQQHESRTGLGLANEKRRKVREKAEVDASQVEQEQREYRDTVRSELDERRLEGKIHAAQKVCETLDTRALEEGEDDAATGHGGERPPPRLRDINVIWRSLVKDRRERDRERLLRQQMLDASLSFSGRQYNEDLPTAPGHGSVSEIRRVIYEDDGEDEDGDEELEDFEAQDGEVRLAAVLAYLRTRHRYCFWCGCQYADRADLEENCPGQEEDDHE